MRLSQPIMRLLRGMGRYLFALFVGLLLFAIALLVISPWLLEWADVGGWSPRTSRGFFYWLERINAVLIRVLIGGWVFALGSCIASFLNVVAYRLPRGRGFLGRSSCPHCRHVLTFWENMPVFGWLRTGGRCQVCRVKISPRYLWVEVLLGAVYLVLFLADVGVGSTIRALQSSNATDQAALVGDIGLFAVHLVAASALFLGFLIVLDIRSLRRLEPADSNPPSSGNGAD